MRGKWDGGCDKEADCIAVERSDWFVRLRSVRFCVCRWTAKFLCSIGKINKSFGVGHPNTRVACCTATILLAGGLLLSTVSIGAAEDEAKPAEKAEQKPPEEQAKQEEQKPDDQAKAKEQAEARIREEIEQYRAAAAALGPTAGTAECVWTGRRVASLLWRDDMDTALRYIGLYDRFGCSQQHLKLAFRCMIE